MSTVSKLQLLLNTAHIFLCIPITVPMSFFSISLQMSPFLKFNFASFFFSSFFLLSSPEVLITQADAVKLQHCPAVIRWRSNKASHSIIVILIWCKSNMLSIPALPTDTQLHREKKIVCFPCFSFADVTKCFVLVFIFIN